MSRQRRTEREGTPKKIQEEHMKSSWKSVKSPVTSQSGYWEGGREEMEWLKAYTVWPGMFNRSKLPSPPPLANPTPFAHNRKALNKNALIKAATSGLAEHSVREQWPPCLCWPGPQGKREQKTGYSNGNQRLATKKGQTPFP